MASECGYFGKDMGKNSKNERTPLHHATQLGHWEIYLVDLDDVSDKILHENKTIYVYFFKVYCHTDHILRQLCYYQNCLLMWFYSSNKRG